MESIGEIVALVSADGEELPQAPKRIGKTREIKSKPLFIRHKVSKRKRATRAKRKEILQF
jgi:hypothetical protein